MLHELKNKPKLQNNKQVAMVLPRKTAKRNKIETKDNKDFKIRFKR